MNTADEYSVPYQLHILLESIDPEDTALREYVRTVVPNLINHCAVMSAKGGKAFLEKCRKAGYNYHDKPDQSMVAHILNGIFPVMRIVRELEQRNLQTLNEVERKLYLTAYTLHDLDKITAEQHLYKMDTEEAKEHFRQAIILWCQQFAIAEFFPDYQDYLNDVMFLIVNTQEFYGADPLPYNYGAFKLSARRKELVRSLSTLSDVLNYRDDISPASICQKTRNKPKIILADLSEGRLTFSYHQIAEVTGLLSNLINNAVMALMREYGHTPLLFFPNGVVYITDTQQAQTMFDSSLLYRSVVEKVSQACKSELMHNLTGYTRAGKGMKFADYYYQIFTIRELLGVSITAVNKIIHEKKKPVSPDRLNAMVEMQKENGKWHIPEEIHLNFEPSIEVDRLAEYLIVMENILITIPVIAEPDAAILNALGLSQHLEDTGQSRIKAAQNTAGISSPGNICKSDEDWTHKN